MKPLVGTMTAEERRQRREECNCMRPVNLTAKALSKAVSAHDTALYLGIDRQVYDFVVRKHAQECMSITPLHDAIRDNEIHIEQTICYMHAHVVGPYLRVTTEYKGSDLKTTVIYEKTKARVH